MAPVKRLNPKFLVLVIALTALIGAGVHGIHTLQISRTTKGFLRQAEAAEKAGDVARAAQFYERYLAYHRDDAETFARYALLVAADAQLTSPEAQARALDALEQAVIRNPARADVRRRLVVLLMNASRYDTARTHLQSLLKSVPKDGDLEFRLGRCEEALGNFDQAAASYEHAIEHDPRQIDAYVRLATLLRTRFNRNDQADALMDARKEGKGVVAANKDSFRAYLARAQYRNDYKVPGVSPLDDVAEALKLAPDEADVLAAASVAARQKGDQAAARRHLEKAIEKYPNEARFYSALAELDIASGKPEAAVETLRRGAKAQPGDATMKWTLADLLTQRGQTEEAEPIVAELRKSALAPGLVDYLTARAHAARSEWAAAAQILEKVGPDLATRAELAEVTKRAYFLLGQCYEQLGNPDQQYSAYRRAAALGLAGDPLSATARAKLVASLTALDRLDEAIDENRRLAGAAGAPADTPLVTARLLAARNLRLPEAEQRWGEVDQALDEAERAMKGAPEVTVARANILISRGRIGPAQALLREARGRFADRVEFPLMLAAVAERMGRGQEAVDTLDEAERRLGRRVDIDMARAALWGTRGGPKAAEALAALEKRVKDYPSAEQERLKTALVDAYTGIGDNARAGELRKELAERQPNNLSLQLALYDAAYLAGDNAGLESAAARIRTIEGENGALWRYARARMLLRQAAEKDPKAIPESVLNETASLLSQALERRPNWAQAVRTQAELDDFKRDPSAALKNYLRAIDLGDRSPQAVHRAVQLLVDAQQFEQANVLLSKLDSSAQTDDTRRLAADVALQTKDYRRAVELARKSVPADDRDYRRFVWLGQTLAAAADQAAAAGRGGEVEAQRDEADRAFRHAIELDGDATDARVAYIQFLAAARRIAEAKAAIEEVRRKVPADKASLVLAQCYAAVRDDRAAELYQKAVTDRPNDPAALRAFATYLISRDRLAEAEPHLKTLVGLKGLSAEEAAWAKRALSASMVWSAEGDRSRVQKALELLNAPSGSETPSAEEFNNRRVRAQILARQPGRDDRRAAIRLLNEIVTRGTPLPVDRLLLARLQEADGDWPAARAQLQALIATDNKNPDYLGFFALALIKRKQFDDAQVWLSQLEKIAPRAVNTTEVKARMLAAQGRGAEAAALLVKMAADNPKLTGAVARLLDQLGRTEEAGRLLEQLASPGDPAALLEFANFLGRHGQTAKALDLCDQAWQTAKPDDVAAASVAILYASASPGDGENARRVEAALDEAIRKNPKADSLRFQVANVLNLRGRPKEAEALLREMAQRKRSAGLLNNLAYMLALQGGRTDEALKVVNEAIELAGAAPALLDTRAVVHMGGGQGPPAVRDLEEAIAGAPNSEMYFHLARAYAMTNRVPDAVEALRKAKELGFTPQSLNPVERPTYDKLVATLPNAPAPAR